MLSKRYVYDGRPSIRLNKLQIKTKEKIERRIRKGIYTFERTTCPVCECENFEDLSEKDRYGLYHPVVICLNCGLIQANPRMTEKSLNIFYKDEYWKLYSGKKMDKHLFVSQYEKGERIYTFLKRLGVDLSDIKVLEVGCGAGGTLYFFQKMGCKVVGCDLNTEYIMFGRNKYNLNLFVGNIYEVAKNLEWTPDLVIYSHVLEHIPNPVEEMIKIRSITDTNSYLYIELPGVKYLTHSYCNDFLKMLQNAHIFYFTLRTLKNIMKKAGWNCIYGNEIIYSIFKKSEIPREKKTEFENDYQEVISFLKKMEYFRLLPTPHKVGKFLLPVFVNFLRQRGLYNVARRFYEKIFLI